MRKSIQALFMTLLLCASVSSSHAIRIKDLSDIKGVRQNQLLGYGLVVGLDGSGDDKKSTFTIQSFVSMLEQMGVTVDSKDIKLKNVAAVMVTAELPPFARTGSRIDALVNSIGNAETLEGGTLLFTPLKGADGEVYAIAQGPISTGGFKVAGTAAGVQKNHPTVGRVVNGAIIERELAFDFGSQEKISLALHSPDFTTAARVARTINKALNAHYADSLDPGTISIAIPEQYGGNLVEFVTLIENLGVTPDTVARIVINERTGTVVMGNNVRISTIAIAHGNLSIQISESRNVSQPLPFANGRTVNSPETNLQVEEGNAPIYVLEHGVSIGEVVRALNKLGVSPRDLIAIFQAIKASGALQAELEII